MNANLKHFKVKSEFFSDDLVVCLLFNKEIRHGAILVAGDTQLASCCVYEMPKQYIQCIKGNDQICLTIRQIPKFLYTKLPGPSHGIFIHQWLHMVTYKSSDDVKTNSSNHLQTCSQLLKAHVAFVEWVFWHNKSKHQGFQHSYWKLCIQQKIKWLGPRNFV